MLHQIILTYLPLYNFALSTCIYWHCRHLKPYVYLGVMSFVVRDLTMQGLYHTVS